MYWIVWIEICWNFSNFCYIALNYTGIGEEGRLKILLKKSN